MANPDLSNIVSTFDPITSSDKRFKQIFEDEYARVIFCGYRIPHLIGDDELGPLMDESLAIANEIRSGDVELNKDSLKVRLSKMCRRVHGIYTTPDITDEFVENLIPYLTGEKEFRYTIKKKQ